MRAVMHGPGDVRLENRPDAAVGEPTDAVIRVSATRVRGSDLWPSREIDRLTGLALAVPLAEAADGCPARDERRPTQVLLQR